MKKLFLKKIWSRILLMSLFLFSFGKGARGEGPAVGWGYPTPPQQISTDTLELTANMIIKITVIPLLIIGFILYGIYFYYKITKKNINSNLKRLFGLGGKSILFALIVYIIIYAIKFYRTNNITKDAINRSDDLALILFAVSSIIAFIIYIFLLVLLIRQIIHYFKSKKEDKINKLKNNNQENENKIIEKKQY